MILSWNDSVPSFIEALQVLTVEQQEKKNFDKDLQKPCSQLLLIVNKLYSFKWLQSLEVANYGCKSPCCRGELERIRDPTTRGPMPTFLHFCISLSPSPSLLPGHHVCSWSNPQRGGNAALQAMPKIRSQLGVLFL